MRLNKLKIKIEEGVEVIDLTEDEPQANFIFH